MKKSIVYLLITSLLFFNGLKSAESKTREVNKASKSDSVLVIKEFKDFYRFDNYYLGGQPTLEAFNWFKSEGIKLVINLRSEKENEQFTNTAFNEEKLLEGYGIKYISIPVSSSESYNPETLLKFSEALNVNEGKVLIHCASGGRVTYFFMAYLIYSKGYSLDEVIIIGKRLKYSFLLENILGKEIKMSLVE